MKISVNKEFETELFEVSDLGVDAPNHYKKPYYVVADAREDITVDFEFQTRREILRENGKAQILHRDLYKAQEYDNFDYAKATANKMKSKKFNLDRNYYVVGHEEAKIIQTHNETNHKKRMKAFE